MHDWTNISCNKTEMYEIFDTILKGINEKYRAILVIFGQSKYFIINFTMAKIIEMEQDQRNEIALYLFNILIVQK